VAGPPAVSPHWLQVRSLGRACCSPASWSGFFVFPCPVRQRGRSQQIAGLLPLPEQFGMPHETETVLTQRGTSKERPKRSSIDELTWISNGSSAIFAGIAESCEMLIQILGEHQTTALLGFGDATRSAGWAGSPAMRPRAATGRFSAWPAQTVAL